MDMSNATSAGPSHGLLDLIFGKVPEKQNDEEQQKDFDPMLALVKTLEKTINQEKEAGDSSWTISGTETGEGVTEENPLTHPGGIPGIGAGQNLASQAGQSVPTPSSGNLTLNDLEFDRNAIANLKSDERQQLMQMVVRVQPLQW